MLKMIYRKKHNLKLPTFWKVGWGGLRAEIDKLI